MLYSLLNHVVRSTGRGEAAATRGDEGEVAFIRDSDMMALWMLMCGDVHMVRKQGFAAGEGMKRRLLGRGIR